MLLLPLYPRSLPTGLQRAWRPPHWFHPCPSLQTHGASERPVTLIQLADVGAVPEPTPPQWIPCFYFGGGVVSKHLFFIWSSGKSETQQKPSNLWISSTSRACLRIRGHRNRLLGSVGRNVGSTTSASFYWFTLILSETEANMLTWKWMFQNLAFVLLPVSSSSASSSWTRTASSSPLSSISSPNPVIKKYISVRRL